MRDWGVEKKYYHDLKGFNYHMTGIQGVVLCVKLCHLEDWTKARRAHADLRYKQGDFPLTEQVADEILSLPICAQLTDDEIRQVVEAIKAF